ncbi:unnamed protein product [Brachionus calyciflorus]|uniref:Uncharacterized protein n=1 Tax=Brachionus calyciflorus TaxID=104777 RepID=A0A813XG49_9BILA|nr:unnamed protein product [Brachionus calyciflorus]
MQLVFLLLSLFLPRVWSNPQSNETKPLIINIEYPKDSGIFVEKDLVDFIQEAKQIFFNTSVPTSIIRKKILMVMGLAGTGKSTLVNYLNDVPLVCVRFINKWVVNFVHPNQSLPGGFGIGYQPRYHTIYPAIYSGPKSDFSFIDNPGFGNTRGLSIEIANGFFRKLVTQDVDEIKFLLMLSYNDLNQRGQQFRDSVKGFSDFLGVFEDNDTKNVSKSIGIVVNHVENQGSTDEEMLIYIKKILNDILDEEKKANTFKNKNEELIFRRVIADNQIEIFSNPRKNAPIEYEQKLKIIYMINKLNYLNRNETKLRVRLEQSYIPMLITQAENYYKLFESDFNTNIIKKSIKFFETSGASEFKNTTILTFKIISKIKEAGQEIRDFDNFLESIDPIILDKQKKNKLVTMATFIKFLLEILPQGSRNNLVFKRKWINIDIDLQLNNLLEKMNQIFLKEYNAFELDLKTKFDTTIQEYGSKIDNIKRYTETVFYCMQLKKIYDFGSQNIELDLFLKRWDELFNTTYTLQFQNRYQLFKEFLDSALVKQDLKTFNRKWIDIDLNKKFSELFDKIIISNEYQLKNLTDIIENVITNGVSDYFTKKVDEAQSFNDINELDNFLSTYEKNFTELASLESLIDNEQTTKMLDSNQIKELKDKLKRHQIINMFLPAHKKIDISFKRKWLGVVFTSKYLALRNELEQYYQENQAKLENEVFELRGHFANVSSVISEFERKFEDSQEKPDIKTIQIFLTHSFVFDINFSLSEDKYETNHPNLIIIAPYVLFPKTVSIDLMSKKVPPYPNYKPRANNGKNSKDFKINAEHGLPGLPGYNAGNLKIYADKIEIKENWFFLANGGKGGQGQSGGHGFNGTDAKDAVLSDLTPGCAFNGLQCNGILREEIPTITSFPDIDLKPCDQRLFSVCKLADVIVHDANPDNKISTRVYIYSEYGATGGGSGRPGMKQIFLMVQWDHKEHKDGYPGNPGIGGKNGNVVVRGFKIFRKTGDQSFDPYFDKILMIDTRGKTGKQDQKINDKGIRQNRQPIIEFKEKESEYLKFIYDLNQKFKYRLINLLSSAKSLQRIDNPFGRSLMKMMKNDGPMTDPFGTPLKTSLHLDEIQSSTTLFCLFERNALSQLSSLPLNPNASNLTISSS